MGVVSIIENQARSLTTARAVQWNKHICGLRATSPTVAKGASLLTQSILYRALNLSRAHGRVNTTGTKSTSGETSVRFATSNASGPGGKYM